MTRRLGVDVGAEVAGTRWLNGGGGSGTKGSSDWWLFGDGGGVQNKEGATGNLMRCSQVREENGGGR